MQARAVELAMNRGVRLQVLSSYGDAPGTMIVHEEEVMEKEQVSAITYKRDEAKITLTRVADRPGVAASIFGPLADDSVNVDMIVQNVSADGKTTDLTFTVARADLERAAATLENRRDELGYADLLSDSKVVSRFPGPGPRKPDHHLGQGRHRYHGRGVGRRAQCRPLRHPHRCGGGLHDRPAHRCQGAKAG